jgi:hypothetical protein
MKKVLLLLPVIAMLFWGCGINKPIVTNNTELNNYKQPFKVFGIGNWRPGYSILTLTDASQQYFTIKTPETTSLKIGDVYQPPL